MRTASQAQLRKVLRTHQATHIIPHCPTCSRPCCALTDVVLDLSFTQLQKLYQITSTKRQLDAAVDAGRGPSWLKRAHGRYYTHEEPCPAYTTDAANPSHKHCAVYGTDAKPNGCDDFPLYVDGDVVVADRRCEAMNIDVLRAELRAAGLSSTLMAQEFDELVNLRIGKARS
jgi:Fe-S-cluster containining protein